MIKWKHVFLKAIKIACGTLFAILTADFLGLQFSTSAGTITLLTLLETKRGTIKLIINRIITFGLTVFLSFILYNMLSNDYIAFLLIISCVVIFINLFNCESTLSVNALIAIHYLTEQNFTLDFLINEFYLLMIGIIFAFLFNQIHHYNAYKDELNDAIDVIENKMKIILEDIVYYIEHPTVHSSSWKELGELEKTIQIYMKHALEYDDNVFSSSTKYYVNYFEMREFQCQTLHMLHYEIRKIRNMPKYAMVISNFIEYLIPFIDQHNDPEDQIERLHRILDEMKCESISSDEFESYAILYHVLLDMEEFLIKKKRFIDQNRYA